MRRTKKKDFLKGIVVLFSLCIAITCTFSSVQAIEINWGNLQWPYSITVDAPGPTEYIFGQVYMAGVTEVAGPPPGIVAQLGYGLTQTPSDWANWITATYNYSYLGSVNDEFMATLSPQYGGTYYYTYRYSYDGGPFTYVDTNGKMSGPSSDRLGYMTVNGPQAPVPVPAAVWLFGAGLIGLAGIRKKFRR